MAFTFAAYIEMYHKPRTIIQIIIRTKLYNNEQAHMRTLNMQRKIKLQFHSANSTCMHTQRRRSYRKMLWITMKE